MTISSENRFHIGQGFGGLFYSIAFGGIFTLFLVKIGTGAFLIGLLSVLPALVALLSLLFLPGIERRYVPAFFRSSVFLAVFCFVMPPFFLAAARLPFVVQIGAYAVFVVVYHAAVQVYSLAWFPVIGDLVPEASRGAFFGKLRFIITAGTFLMMRATAEILGEDPSFFRFFIVFLVLCLLQILRPVCFKGITIPPAPSAFDRTPADFSVRRTLLGTRESRLFCGYLAFFTFLNAFAGPFIVPYLKTEIGLPTSFIVSLLSLQTVGYGIACLFWGRLNDRHGSRMVLFFSLLPAPFCCVLLATLQRLPPEWVRPALIAFFTVSGTVGAGQDMANSTRRMAIAPDGARFAYLAWVMVLCAQAPVLLGAPLGGLFIEGNHSLEIAGWNAYNLLFCSIAVGDVLLLWTVVRMRPLREREEDLKTIVRGAVTDGLLRFREFLISPP